ASALAQQLSALCLCVSAALRLGIWFFIALPCMRQIYVYTTNPACKRIGQRYLPSVSFLFLVTHLLSVDDCDCELCEPGNHTFLGLCIIITELLIIIKFSPGEFTKPMPEGVQYCAASSINYFAASSAVFFLGSLVRVWCSVLPRVR